MVHGRAVRFFALLGASLGELISLTESNWDEETAGKHVWVKFTYPQKCVICSLFTESWKRLAEEYQDTVGIGIYRVDCSDSGKSLCKKTGAADFPYFLHGDPTDMQSMTSWDGEYQWLGKKGIKKAAKKILGRPCGPQNVTACTTAAKAHVDEAYAMPLEELQAEVDRLNTTFRERQRTVGEARAPDDAAYMEVMPHLHDRYEASAADRKALKAATTPEETKEIKERMKERQLEMAEYQKEMKRLMPLRKKHDEDAKAIDDEISATGYRLRVRVLWDRTPKEAPEEDVEPKESESPPKEEL